MDVSQWARVNKIPVKKLFPPVITEIQPHVQEDEHALGVFNFNRHFLEREQNLLTLEEVAIRSDAGMVELPDGKICFEGNWWLPDMKVHTAYRQRFFIKRRTLNGDWYSLLSMYSSGYYHWFHDVLPRLEMALPFLPADTRFLINADLHEYQTESLKAYGILPERMEFQLKGQLSKVERLWFATPLGLESMGSGQVINRVATRLKDCFAEKSADVKPTKLYVSRRNAASRRIINENEFQSVLIELGFEPVVLEDLPWVDQLKLFSRAQSVLGPHGAGLVNMMFMPGKSSVYEVAHQALPSPHFLVLARQLGHRFQRLHAEPLEKGSNADMRLTHLKAALEAGQIQ